jgi:ring-1,2-phenylacetyl-CoA epoxidase subunit PaaA
MAVQYRSEDETRQHLRAGKLIEGLEHMSPAYLEGMKRILTVSADTEMISAPAYWRAAQDAPTLNAFGSAISIIQDELGHAHIAYRLLEDLGVDKDWLIYERPATQWKHPYAFDVPLDSWVELVVANALYDQAGYELLSDVYHSTTFGPWKRALAKVDKEETFHLRHGQQWIRRLVQHPEQKARLQRAVDWMFLLTVEWFGLPDAEKRHTEQLEYGFKGKSNDQLRQSWMGKVVPFCDEVGLQVPAHYAQQQQQYVLEVPFPARFDAANKRWLFAQGQSTWDEVLRRWKARGPSNAEFVAQLQRGRHARPNGRSAGVARFGR